MHRIAAWAFLLACVPSLALAQSASAGFATQSVFLSQNPVTAGESVLVYASITNTSDAAFQGLVMFHDATANADIGSVSVSLSPGEAQLVSISWTPTAGAHIVTAQLENGSGASIASESAHFAIAPAAAAPAVGTQNPPVESSVPLDQSIAGFSPQAANVVSPTLNFLDGARRAVANTLNNQIAQTRPKLPGQVLGTTTNMPQGIVGWFFAVWWTVYFYLLVILRSVITSIAFFYPILAALFIYLLYRLYRKMSGPKYRY